MIVLISVWPVFMSLPASGDFGLRRQLQQRRDVGASGSAPRSRTECLRLIAAYA